MRRVLNNFARNTQAHIHRQVVGTKPVITVFESLDEF